MSNPKRILILTSDAGFGHRAAAEAMAAALQEMYGDRCTTLIVNPLDDPRAPAILRDSPAEYDHVVRQSPEFYKLRYEVSDAPLPAAIIERVMAMMLFDTMRNTLQQHQPDAIVCSYLFYTAAIKAVFDSNKVEIPLITVVTDLVNVHRIWFNSAVDLCLAPTQAAFDQALENGLAPEQVLLTGVPINPKLAQPHPPRAALRATLGWQPDLTTALAVGSKRVPNVTEMLHGLNHAGLPLQLVIVAGGDDELYEKLRKTEWHAVTQLYHYVEDMSTFLHAADCVISKAGGLIVSEALACGLPMVLVDVIPGHETGNAEYVIEGGAGEQANNPLEVLAIMCHWLERDGELLTQRANQARNLGHPRAAYTAAEKIWGLAQRGPRPQPPRSLITLPKLAEVLGLGDEPGPETKPEG
ncbi:MAG TPA: glycosyltransferase [Anaerolineae bacterium]|nr:glycosyltransferase [Anaerolineae bacterium]